MTALQYVKPIPILLKDDPRFNEAWVRDRIVEDPSILGLGDLEIVAMERSHPKAGRLDLLLRDSETGKRYEVELMLGQVDESHIIRTIEYWDIERKRYPQYEHTAVIVAERITSRFLNVIGLFNGSIPLIAIQLTALQVGDSVVLYGTRVLDELVLGTDEEDTAAGEPTDRAYWERRGTKESMQVVDECFAMLRAINPALELKYNKFYIGMTDNGRANTFVTFRAKKQWTALEVKVTDLDGWQTRLEEAGINMMPVDTRYSAVRPRLTRRDLHQHRDVLRELFEVADREQRA